MAADCGEAVDSQLHAEGSPSAVTERAVIFLQQMLPEASWISAGVLLLLFSVKSVTVLFPLAPLYLVSGLIFPPLQAVAVSTGGLTLAVLIPYCIGFHRGRGAMQRLLCRFPAAGRLLELQNRNRFLACFLSRVVGFLPGDLVSLFFGACRLPAAVYLIGSVSGSLLSIFSTTLLGTALKNPASPEFAAVLLLRILLAAGSAALNAAVKKTARPHKEQK